MADPYWRYAADRGAQTAFPGYLSSENSALASRSLFGNSDPHGAASDYLHKDILPSRSGIYDLGDITATTNHATPILGGLTPGASVRRFTPLEDPDLVRRDAASGVKPGITEREYSNSLRKSEAPLEAESSMLFVDGLPNDCSRREAAHLFRPFIGFKEIKVIHKEPRRSGDKARVLCFVEFNDAKCARTALEALQGYKFDDKTPDALALRIQSVKFPFRPPVRD
uniref:RNA-binding protein with multiple splicing 2 n=1 Tax=Anthurium amnicola TaxID=1678845 RepID=A0A1D1YZD7_9ARAE